LSFRQCFGGKSKPDFLLEECSLWL
jgi:hypothetical protein